MPEPGKYIVLEGDEGSGKGTQVELLRERLAKWPIAVEVVREPGGDPVAEQMRTLLKHSEHTITPLAEVFGFLMARTQVLELVVKPLLEDGIWVLSDRSTLSTIVYQGVMRGLLPRDPQGFMMACQLAQVVEPDLMIVLDVPFEVSAERIAGRGEQTDRFESVGDESRRKVNNGYREEMGRIPHSRLVRGTGTELEVHRQVWANVQALLPKEAQ